MRQLAERVAERWAEPVGDVLPGNPSCGESIKFYFASRQYIYIKIPVTVGVFFAQHLTIHFGEIVEQQPHEHIV